MPFLSEKDNAILENISEAINKIIEISKPYTSLEKFQDNFIHFDAVLMNFIVIGEMVSKLSEEFKENNEQIEWRKINAFRNILAHNYFGIDDKAVWQIIQDDIPKLKKSLREIFNSD